MTRKLLSVLFFISFCNSGWTQDFDLYQKEWFIQSGDTLPYRILLPENYDSGKAYPLVFFLHGRGESGRDNEKQLTHGAFLFLRDSVRKKYPAIVVFPQCAANGYWSNVHTILTEKSKRAFYFIEDGDPSLSMRLLMGLVDNMLLRFPIRKQQVYVMGLSMGGMGTFELVRRKPDVFAAAVPVCGGAHPGTASKLLKTKWWIFHGAKDDVVPPEKSEKMARAIKMRKGMMRFTLYPEANHNSWDAAFAEPELLSWLFSQKK